ncbi:hypothetical protein [Streptacidiphilus neutrinimicus]|uniref:hypothetical protein n=1 Tax=Streptacidiphilus neutrinimicus TaxID=105420 RepID=UPI0005A96E46|nr:hypothetical protein [Streptacidiphilus neutrinimicus]
MSLPSYEPFHQPGRPYLTDSVLEDEPDWALARLALSERSFATYKDDPRADEVRRIGEHFTADEARRVDAFLAASIHDTDRLDAIDAAGTLNRVDVDWVIAELRRAWGQLDRLRDCLDDSGSLLANTYAASSVDYVRWSRKLQAFSPCPAPDPARPAPSTGR